MDHTLLPCDTGSLWSQFLAKRGLIDDSQSAERERFLRDYQAGVLDLDAAYSYEFKVLQLFAPDERRQLIAKFFRGELQPLITPQTLACFAKHRVQGDYLVMITATVDDIARPVADFFGFDHMIASRGVVDTEGNYTGEVELEPCMGRGKLVHLEKWLTDSCNNPNHYTFYSDSHNDLPLLEQVDVPIAVDPDAKLRAIAQTNGWDIISFLEQ